MISDAPYGFREPIFGAGGGAAVGLGGAAGMLGVLKALESVSGLQLSLFLSKLGLVVLPGCRQTCGEPFLILAGLGVHGVVGVVCGSLHAVSQQRVPVRGLIAVGVFYGFFLWIVSGLLAGPVGGAELKRMIRFWPWFLASLGYGIWLSTMAAWVDKRRPKPSRLVSPD